jgi:hypothetical protein
MSLFSFNLDNPIFLAAAFITALIVVVSAGRKIAVIARRITHFLDDYLGVEGRPGVPARPGLTERIQKIEHELHPNSGTSIRDSLDRVEAEITEIKGIAQQALDNSANTAASLELIKGGKGAA